MLNHSQYNHYVSLFLILVSGLGFAMAMPWLLNTQSTAAQSVYDQASVDQCFATYNDGSTILSGHDASAVQQAVDSASPGDIVKVAGTCIGVETRAGLTQTVFISKSLTLEGGHTPADWTLAPDTDKYPTTLDADGGGRVILISGTNDVTLDSISVTGGLADDGTLDNNGGGIWSNSEMTLTNAIIYSNTAALFGGGMLNRNISPRISNVIFSGNLADSGGAMENWGPGGASSPILTNVLFSGNSAIRNGGAMYNYGYEGISSPNLTNVTFSGNFASHRGGAMYNYGLDGTSILNMYNSILWNNKAISGTSTIDAAIHNNGAAIFLTYSLVEGAFESGSWAGNGYLNGGDNIDQDPLFVEPISPSTAPTITGNLRLQENSPAIDAGDNDYALDISADLDGEERIKDGNGDGVATVDMGAYEYQIPYTKNTFLPLVKR